MSSAGELSHAPGTAGPRRFSAGRDLDFFIEPGWCVELLLDTERFSGYVWDPACGSGVIVSACLDRGISAVGSDIVDRGFGGVQDFLDPDAHFANVENIVCNPPFGVAAEFVLRALGCAGQKVAMLVQAKFLFSQGRHELFIRFPPARLHFLSTRPSMPPGEELLAGRMKAAGGKLDYLWMVWERGHVVATEARWLLRGGH